MNVLIAYASKYGATQEIAQRVGEVLERGGAHVDVRPAEDVTSVQGFGAVVIGSGVYSANWLPDAVELLESFQDDLSSKAVWLFSSGPTAEGDPAEVLGGWTFPANLQPLIDSIHPKNVALFAGKIDANKLSLEDWLSNRSMRGVVGDYRDWQTIEAWGERISQSLGVPTPPVQAG